MNANIKRIIYTFSLIALVGCESLNDHPTEMRNRINSGDCRAAENYANSNFGYEYLSWMLGNVALDCRKNRRMAIEYYKAGARANSKYSNLSVNALIALGESPPEQTRQVIINSPPQSQPQTIIQTPQNRQQPMGQNMNSCIQDGGSLYCPNNTNPRR